MPYSGDQWEKIPLIVVVSGRSNPLNMWSVGEGPHYIDCQLGPASLTLVVSGKKVPICWGFAGKSDALHWWSEGEGSPFSQWSGPIGGQWVKCQRTLVVSGGGLFYIGGQWRRALLHWWSLEWSHWWSVGKVSP